MRKGRVVLRLLLYRCLLRRRECTRAPFLVAVLFTAVVAGASLCAAGVADSAESWAAESGSEMNARAEQGVEMAARIVENAWKNKTPAYVGRCIRGWKYLAAVGHDETRAQLLELVRTDEDGGAIEANCRLCELGDARGTDYLVSVICDQREPLFKRGKSLVIYSGSSLEHLTRRLPRGVEEFCCELLERSDLKYHKLVLQMLCEAATERSRECLETLLQRTDNECFAQWAVEGLNRIRNPASRGVLRRAATESPWIGVRVRAIEGLCNVGDADFARQLAEEVLSSETALSTRMDYAYALARAGDNSHLSVIQAAMDDSDPYERAVAYRMLWLLGDESFLERAAGDLAPRKGYVGFDMICMQVVKEGSEKDQLRRKYLLKIAPHGLTDKAKWEALACLLSCSDTQLASALPICKPVLTEPIVTVPSIPGPGADEGYRAELNERLYEWRLQVVKLVILLRIGDAELKERAMARLEAMYESTANFQYDILRMLGWCKYKPAQPLLAEAMKSASHNSPHLYATDSLRSQATDSLRLQAAVVFLAIEAGETY